MEHLKTLREVCNELSISRRTVQWYEHRKLIKPSARNKYGHLLYDEEAVKRIAFIRFAQETGLSVADIGGLIDSPLEDIKTALSRQADILLERKIRMEKQLSQIENLNRSDSREDYLNEVLKIIKGGSSK